VLSLDSSCTRIKVATLCYNDPKESAKYTIRILHQRNEIWKSNSFPHTFCTLEGKRDSGEHCCNKTYKRTLAYPSI
jgi:hypothetical protein